MNRPRIKVEPRKDILDGLPVRNKQAIKDAQVYLDMTDDGFRNLPAFYEDGSVRFYEVGGMLLGKSALTRFIETIKTK
jgi:hypothetical protein